MDEHIPLELFDVIHKGWKVGQTRLPKIIGDTIQFVDYPNAKFRVVNFDLDRKEYYVDETK